MCTDFINTASPSRKTHVYGDNSMDLLINHHIIILEQFPLIPFFNKYLLNSYLPSIVLNTQCVLYLLCLILTTILLRGILMENLKGRN